MMAAPQSRLVSARQMGWGWFELPWTTPGSRQPKAKSLPQVSLRLSRPRVVKGLCQLLGQLPESWGTWGTWFCGSVCSSAQLTGSRGIQGPTRPYNTSLFPGNFQLRGWTWQALRRGPLSTLCNISRGWYNLFCHTGVVTPW